MKLTPTLLIILLTVGFARGETISREEYNKMLSYDTAELERNASQHVGQLVVLRFSLRARSDARDVSDGWRETFLSSIPSGNYTSTPFRVWFPKEANSWFEKIPHDYAQGRRVLVAYGRVGADPKGRHLLKLIGLSLRVTSSGAEITW